jgi:hypothetical protein
MLTSYLEARINVVYVVSGKVLVRVWNVTSRQHQRKISKYLGKCRKTSKKYENTHFFQFFKHVKQQHQINTLLHKYENTTNK